MPLDASQPVSPRYGNLQVRRPPCSPRTRFHEAGDWTAVIVSLAAKGVLESPRGKPVTPRSQQEEKIQATFATVHGAADKGDQPPPCNVP